MKSIFVTGLNKLVRRTNMGLFMVLTCVFYQPVFAQTSELPETPPSERESRPLRTLDDAIATILSRDPVNQLPCGQFNFITNPGGSTPNEGSSGSQRDISNRELLSICSRNIPASGSLSSSGGSNVNVVDSLPLTLNYFKALQKQSSQRGGGASSDDVMTAKINNQWGLFATAQFESLDRERTNLGGAFESDVFNFLVGTTYALNDSTTLGVAFNLVEHEGDYNVGGSFDIGSQGIRLLASRQLSDKAYIDVAISQTEHSNERVRVSNFIETDLNSGVPSLSLTGLEQETDFDFDEISLSVSGGYDIITGPFNLTFQWGGSWSTSDYGTYSEIGNSGFEVTIHDDERDSLQIATGIQAAWVRNANFGVIIPQINVTLKNELDDESRQVEFSFVGDPNSQRFTFDTDEGDREFLEMSLGAVAIFKNGWQGYANLQTLIGHDFFDNTIVSLGFQVAL